MANIVMGMVTMMIISITMTTTMVKKIMIRGRVHIT